jgi:glutamate-5-semialdehyde dehydrogenase
MKNTCPNQITTAAFRRLAVLLTALLLCLSAGTSAFSESAAVDAASSESAAWLAAEAPVREGDRTVVLRADAEAGKFLPFAEPATEEDFGTEYLALMLSVKTVDSLAEAIEHINRYHTGHSDCIVTGNEEAAGRFLREIDSACVYVNVSTRFTDGFEFGFGAEIGISTQKLQARGPMGLREITSYKYQITGQGQVRG